jgi:hypothetical protein
LHADPCTVYISPLLIYLKSAMRRRMTRATQLLKLGLFFQSTLGNGNPVLVALAVSLV